MIKMLTACTQEIDEIDAAVAEILEQLDIENQLLEHSLGFLNCYQEFVDSGVVKAICDRLPFDVIGNTTAGNAVPMHAGTMQLCIGVLTSDELTFVSVMQDGITPERSVSLIQQGYRRAYEQQGDKPALVYAVIPFLEDLGAEVMAQALFEVVGDVPVYGGITCNHTISTAGAATIFNGEIRQDAAVYALIYGNIKPKFIFSKFPEEKKQIYRGLVTSADGHVVKTINNKPAEEYMKQIGLTRDGGLDEELIKTIALSVDFKDGTLPIVRAILNFSEEGNMNCCGIIPEQTSLSVGMIDGTEVMDTARATLNQMVATERPQALIAVSCMARELSLGVASSSELELVGECVGTAVPYLCYYSAGEICPQYTEDGKVINRFHNFTFTGCWF